MNKKRLCSYVLAGLLSLTTVGDASNVFAKSDNVINYEHKDFDFSNESYPNILNPISEWEMQYDELYFNDFEYLFSTFNGRTVAFPVLFLERRYLKKETEETKEFRDLQIREYKENYEYLKKYLSKGYEKKFDNYGIYYIIREISSLKDIGIVYFSIINQNLIEIPNDDFFRDIYNETFPEVFTIDRLEKRIAYSGLHINFSKIPEDILNGETSISREEFVEIYKQIIPFEFWPIVEEKEINESLNIPEVKEETLKTSIKDLYLMHLSSNKEGIINDKLFLVKDIGASDLELVEFFSNAFALDYKSNRVYYENFDINPEDYEYYNIYGFSNQSSLSSDLKEYEPHFLKIKTTEDAINFLKMFPIECQLDYLNLDYTNSTTVKNIPKPESKILKKNPKNI